MKIAKKSPEIKVKNEELISTMLDELRMAVRWQRPSILVSTCQSDLVMTLAQLDLQNRLLKHRLDVIQVVINPKNFDILPDLAHSPRREESVFFVSGLDHGGGVDGMNAYRALNMRRELLVDFQVRAVFWLSEKEANDLPSNALDFWAFRHHTLELSGKITPRKVLSVTRKLNPESWQAEALLRESPAGINLRQDLLNEIPEWKEAPVIRAELLMSLAGLNWAAGTLSLARDQVKQSLQIARDQSLASLQARSWNGLGLVLESLNHPDQALESFQRSLKLDPALASAWENLGLHYRRSNEPEKAVGASLKALELDPHLLNSWLNLAVIHANQGKLDLALQACRKALRMKPKNESALRLEGSLLLQKRQHSAALQAFQKANRVNHLNADTWSQLAQLYKEMGLINQAMRAFYKVARLDPKSALPWVEIARLYRKKNKFVEARRAYRSAIALDPANQDYRQALTACTSRQVPSA